MKKANYDPLTDTINNCEPYTFIWWHEKGHQNQFSYKWVRKWDYNLHKYPYLYKIWGVFLEIDANIYAVSKKIKWFRKKP